MTISNEDIMQVIKEMNVNIEKNNAINAELIKELESVKKTSVCLEEKTNRLQQEVNFLKRQLRKNNFLVHNVPLSENKNSLDKVKNIFNDINITLPDHAINNIFRRGKGPILVSLNNHILKQDI